MKAHLRRIQISPKKTNLVAGLVRRYSVLKALEVLKFTPKRAAKILYKVLQSAASNAENNHKEKRENLKIKQIIVNKGPFYKRHIPSTRGRALPIHKPTSNITIELEQVA